MSQNGSLANASGSPHVVVVGGGFGGVAAAQGAEKRPGPRHTGRQDELSPLPAAALPGGDRHPRARHDHHADSLLVPWPEKRRRAHGRGDGVDKERRLVELDGGADTLTYDYLVLATGVHGSYFGHDEWAPLAPSMKTLADAEFLRRRIIGALEQADQDDDPKLREQLLTFVLVGAGPTGCELAGELAEHFRRVPTEYRHIDPRQAHIILVEAGPRALATFSEELGPGAVAKLRSLGVDVRLGKAVEMVDADGVVIAGERVQTRTVLWTAGVAASPAGRWLGVETDRAGTGRGRAGPHASPAIPRFSWSVIPRTSKTMARLCRALPRWRSRAANTPRTPSARACLHQPPPSAVRVLRQGQHGHHLGHVRDHGKGQA